MIFKSKNSLLQHCIVKGRGVVEHITKRDRAQNITRRYRCAPTDPSSSAHCVMCSHDERKHNAPTRHQTMCAWASSKRARRELLGDMLRLSWHCGAPETWHQPLNPARSSNDNVSFGQALSHAGRGRTGRAPAGCAPKLVEKPVPPHQKAVSPGSAN